MFGGKYNKEIFFMTSTKEQVEVTDFTRYKAYSQLMELAENPYDLTKPGNINRQRLNHFLAESCGYKMLYGTERITDDVLHALIELAHEANAWQKMEKMQSGEVMNYVEGCQCENRQVLHTATRDFFDHKNTDKRAIEAAQIARNEMDRLKAFIHKLEQENRFTDLVSVAIGGSDLGPKAHFLALQHLLKPGKKVHFIGNIDPDDPALILKNLDLSKTLVLIVSKSGTTIETVTNEAFLRKYFQDAGLKPEEHFISVTSQGSPQDNTQKYLECFHTWDWVGGRFSTSSVVGGVMMSFAYGFETFWEFLRGANAMDKAALNREVRHNIPLLGALLGIWNRNFLGYPNLAIVPYSQALSRYAAHVQQVDMESNGKRIDQKGKPVNFATGPILFGEPGTPAQHSFYQLLHQGTDIVPLEIIGFKYNQTGEDVLVNGTTSQEKLLAFLFAQILALAGGKPSDNPNKVFPGNRPSHLLFANRLTPYALGALLAYYENKVAFQGFIWGLNSFDQEGVMLGKELASRVLSRILAKKGQGGDPNPYPEGDAFLEFLDTI
jgi:glucose-6-phosphate isomerase